MELKEKDLVHRLQQAQSSGQSVDQQWYSDAATFLHHAEHAEHWWCRHAVLARGLAQLLVYHDGEAVVQRIWAEMSKQLSQCAQCVMEYHSAQAYFKETLDEAASDPLLAVMRRLDEERLAAVLGEAPAVQSGEDLRPSLVTALFEALSYDSLLEDREVMQKLQAALLHLSRSCELAWADGGRYPGLYRLMAHPDTAVRSLIAPIVKELGPFADELELGSISSVLDHWMHLLQFDLFEVAQASAGGRERFNQPREPLWLALNALLHMLRPPAMHALVQWYGLLPEVVVNHLGAAGRVGRCAVGCLRSLLDGLGGKVWQFSLGGAQRVVEVLLQAAFRSREPPLHAEIVRVFRPLLKSCETGKVRAVQRKVFFFLLHQVPASGNFTPLSRTIAQTTAFDIMAACLRAGRPICQDMDIYGPALCNIVHEVPQQAAVKSHGMAVAICIALIQADACALAALLQASHTSSVTALLAVRSSEGCGVDVGQACHLAAQNADTWECTPALWQGLSQCQQPQISVALVCAAATLSQCQAPQQAQHAQDGVSAGGAGFHRHGSAMMPHALQAAMSWPRQCSVDAAATCSVRASEHAGLLLQASRKAACTHLGWLLRRKQPFHAAGTPLLAQAVESLLRLLFGVHAPLRDLAREVLQRHTQEASLADVLSSLLWTPANVEAVSGAAAAAVQWLQAAPVSQVMVSTAGQHALAFLDALFLAAANHPHGGNLDLEAVVPPLWDFVMGVLDEGAPAAKLLTARQAHTHMFSLLPVLWTLLAPLEELQPDDLLWIGAALQYGLLLDTALVEGWARAMQKVLHGLPSPATELLPPEVLQIAAQAMSSHNGLPDSARLLLAPHLGRLAPGNLGQSALDALPSRAAQAASPGYSAAAAGKAPVRSHYWSSSKADDNARAAQHSRHWGSSAANGNAGAGHQHDADSEDDVPLAQRQNGRRAASNSQRPAVAQQPFLRKGHTSAASVQQVVDLTEDEPGLAEKSNQQHQQQLTPIFKSNSNVGQAGQHSAAQRNHQADLASFWGQRSTEIKEISAQRQPGSGHRGKWQQGAHAGRDVHAAPAGSSTQTLQHQHRSQPAQQPLPTSYNTTHSSHSGFASHHANPSRPPDPADPDLAWPDQWPERSVSWSKPTANSTIPTRLPDPNSGQIWPEAWPRKTVPGTAAGTARQALKRPSMRRPGAGPPPKRLKAALEDHLQQQAKLQRAMDRNQRGNVADGRMRQAQTHDSGRSEASRERAAQRQPGVPRPRSRTASPARELEMSHHRQGHVGGHAANATSREPSPFEYRPEPQLASRPPSRPQSREPSPNPNMLDLEEDHDLDAELSAFRQAQQPRDDNAMLSRLTMPNAAPAVKVQRRTIQLAAVPGHVSTAQWAQRRVAQPAAEPPPQAALTVEQVQQELLAWDYFALLAGKTGGGAALMGGKVPKAFSSIGHYTRVFRGLLLEELRAHVQKAHEDWSKLKGRSESSSLSFPLQLRENQKHSVLHNMVFSQDCADRDHYCRAEDLLLLTRRPLAALPAEKDDKVPSVHLLGLVMKAERDEASGGRSRNVHVIANLGTEVVGRDAQRLEAAQKALLQGTTWHVTRIMSWTPHLRQFLALCRAFSLPPPLLQQILHPQPPSQGHAAPRLDRCALPPGLHQALAADYNSSQQRAIAASLGGSGQFTLVQGPPGTGKTAAILAIVSGILAKNPSTGHSTVANAEPSKKGSKKHKGGTAGVAACAGPSKEGSKKHTGGTAGVAADAAIPQACLVMGQPPPARVLVCAQSNAAIDELIARLAVQGLYRAPGGRRECPSMLRMGKLETAHPLVQAFHIDAVAQRFEGTEDSTTTAVGEVERAKQRTQELRSRLAQLQQQINEVDARNAASAAAAAERGEGKDGSARDAAETEPQGHRTGSKSRSASPDAEGGRNPGVKEAAKAEPKRQKPGSKSRSATPEAQPGNAKEAAGKQPSRAGSAKEAAKKKAADRDGSAPEAAEQPASKVAMNLSAMLDRKRQLRLELNKAQSEYKSGGERVARARREVRQAVVKSAEVVACTLSSAGGDLLSLLKTGPFFNALIIDEAAQALEPAALIALQLVAPSGRIVLVGDPKQLPATVISRAAEAANLAQSLFERLQQAGYPVAMLSEQYRMHPAISAWPSAFFYDGKLVDGRGIREGGERDAAFHKQPCFPPLAFYDCLEGRERAGSREGSGGSLSNALEAELACTLYTGVMRQYAAELGSVAVLTPYRAQLSTLRSVFRRAHGEDGIANIDFATVDGFQGKEADVVIFSCVRAHQLRSGMGSVGFLADVRRMNVALTRARRALWIIGHSQTLLSSPPWKALIEHTQHHACFFRTHHPFASILTASKKQLQGR